MGSTQAYGYAEFGGRAAMIAHLTSNHYPPIPAECAEAAEKAVESVAAHYLTGDMTNDETRIDLPAGVTYKGVDAAPAWQIVSAWHLDAWVEVEIVRQQGVEGEEIDEFAANAQLAREFGEIARGGEEA